MNKDLRSYLTDLADTVPGDLLRVDTRVDRRFGITAHAAAASSQGHQPAFYFTDVDGSSLACVTNLLATHERMALALGCPVEELTRSSATLQPQAEHPPVEVAADTAPVKRVIRRDDEVRLADLPVPVHNELDGGPFLTAAMTVMRDPDSGQLNLGIYREQVYDERRLGVWFFGSHHGGSIHRRYEERGEPAPVAIVIGHHPGMLMGAVSRVPGIGGEYDAAGAFLGEPVDLVRAETSDLLVPARAEIVLEGVIVPGEVREEGPFAEWPGYYVGGGRKPVIRVDAITMREDAIFQDIQASGTEHRLMGALPRVLSVRRNVGQAVPGLRAVNIPLHARMHCYLAIRKEQDNDPVRAAFAALNTEPENLRMIVVVDDDIDVHDEQELFWAIGTRFDADRDLQVIPRWNGPGGLLPTNWEYDTDGDRTPRMSSAIIIDATKPAPPVRFPTRARVPEDAVRNVDLGQATTVKSAKDLPWHV